MFLLLFSHPVLSDSLQPHGLQHTKPPCPSLSSEACPSLCPLLWWCHPAISSLVSPFFSCPQSFPASGTFPVSKLFASDDQNTGVSASASLLPVIIQGWFPLRLIYFISLLSKELAQVFSSTTVQRHQFFGTLPSLLSSSQQPYMTTWKTVALTIRTFVSKLLPLLSNRLSRFVIAFLPRSKVLWFHGCNHHLQWF